MNKNNLAARMRYIVQTALNPVLHATGFRGRGKTYRATVGELMWIVEIQRGRWSDEAESEFTVNGGVYVPGIVSAYSGRSEPKLPKIPDCCVSARIGMLCKSRLDKWWRVAADAAHADRADRQVAQEVREWVVGLLLPFLSRFAVLSDVAEFLESTAGSADVVAGPPSIAQRLAYAALIYSAMGEAANAVATMKRAAQEARNTPLEEHITCLSERAFHA